jgi:hypothetical protein
VKVPALQLESEVAESSLRTSSTKVKSRHRIPKKSASRVDVALNIARHQTKIVIAQLS